MNAHETNIRVVQRVVNWLERTEAWLYDQITSLPDEVAVTVASDRRVNASEFPFHSVDVLQERGVIPFLIEKSIERARPGTGLHLRRVLRQTRANLLHSHFGPVGWEALRPASKAGVPHIVTFYGRDVTQVPRNPEWRHRYADLFKQVDAVLCEGPHMAREIALLGCEDRKIILHRLGVQVSTFEFMPRYPKSDTLKVLIVGRFTEKKGFPIAFKALERMQTSMRISVTVVGSAASDRISQSEGEKITQAAASSGLDTRFLGSVDHATLKQLYYEHDVFLSPSVTASDGDTEGGAPVSIIEAAATGMPVVSTTHCDIPDVLAKGRHLLAQEGDIDDLVSRLEWLLENEWTSFLGDIRVDLEQRYDSRDQGLRLAAIYQMVAANAIPRGMGTA